MRQQQLNHLEIMWSDHNDSCRQMLNKVGIYVYSVIHLFVFSFKNLGNYSSNVSVAFDVSMFTFYQNKNNIGDVSHFPIDLTEF